MDLDAIAAVKATEAGWARAHRELDLAAVEAILSDDYLQVSADGSLVTKSELLTSYRSGERRWQVAASSDLQVRLVGEAAVVVGTWRGVGVNAGEPFDYRARFMAVYRKEDGVWRLFREASIPIG